MSENNPEARAAKEWYGYGRWDAPYWFVGMEPGGTNHPELYTSWEASGGGPMIDAKRHEDEWNARVSHDLQTRYFAENMQVQRGTWQPLIHILSGFTNSAEDPHHYQRDKWGRAGGEIALIELSSIASRDLSVPGDREKYQTSRIDAIRQHLIDDKPQLVVFYGKTYDEQYAAIAGGSFDGDDVCWSGTTLCALTAHPSRPTKSYEFWTDYGRRLRKVVDARTK
jgi:hypothetical protein